MTEQVLDYFTMQPPRHSRAAVASLSLSIGSAIALVGVVLLSPSKSAGSVAEASTAQELLAMLAFLLALAGFILGLLGIRRPNSIKLFAYVGFAQSACILLLMVLGVA